MGRGFLTLHFFCLHNSVGSGSKNIPEEFELISSKQFLPELSDYLTKFSEILEKSASAGAQKRLELEKMAHDVSNRDLMTKVALSQAQSKLY